jgi:hypothetical protein
VPTTIKLHDQLRVHLNTGVLADDHSHLTWGAGIEWQVEKSWSLIAESFGLTGHLDQPRLQAGLRFAPGNPVDIDIIYGHNVTGESAHWITTGLTVRF